MSNVLDKSFSLATRMVLTGGKGVNLIGSKLAMVGADELVDGGFFIISTNENDKLYFSPKFKALTGYSDRQLSTDNSFYSIVETSSLKTLREGLKANCDFYIELVLKTKFKVDILMKCNANRVGNYLILSVNKVIK